MSSSKYEAFLWVFNKSENQSPAIRPQRDFDGVENKITFMQELKTKSTY